MILSIGMIVKNEEKYLDRCLLALKPVLDKVDSELIIVDTGSTDNTINIAKKHTDKVYHFKWCNDFAAARNETINHASGEWYMFLDADEILTDPTELIDFFNSGKYKKYDNAKYEMISYRDEKNFSQVKTLLYRLYKLNPTTRFTGLVHEIIKPYGEFVVLSNTVFEHYGYVFNSEKDAQKKAKRNYDLLLNEIKKGNDTPMIRNQLSESYSMAKNYREAVKHALSGIELIENPSDNIFTFALYANLIYSSFYLNDFQNLITYAEQYFSYKSIMLSTDIDVYAYLCFTYFKLYDYDNCIKSFENYKNLYKKYILKELYTKELTARSLLAADDYSLYRASWFAASSFVELNMYDDAISILNDESLIDYSNVESISPYLSVYFNIMDKTKNYSNLIILYKYFSNLNKTYQSTFEDTIDIFSSKIACNKNLILEEFNMSNYLTQYTDYMKLIHAYENNFSNFREQIIDFLNNANNLDGKYSKLIYFIIIKNIPISLLHDKLDINLLSSMLAQLNIEYGNFIDYIIKYECNSITLVNSYWLKKLYETALMLIKDLNYNSCTILSEKYLVSFNNYFNTIYSLNIMNDVDINVTQNDIKFGYFYSKAFEYKKNKEFNNYIKYLKSALLSDERYKELISILLDNLEKSENAEEDEFNKLSIIIKNNIVSMINSSKFTDAIILLSEYKELNPYDKDIKKLENLLNTYER